MWKHFKNDDFKSDDKVFSGTQLSLRCYESHPVLELGTGKLYGGSASHPAFKQADIYVALQSGSYSGRGTDPWDKGKKTIEVHYSIMDMKTPYDVTRFKKMVTWLCTQLQDGKNVHVGCIGGHGRTGLVFSAIVAEMLAKKNAIQYVRKHYCKKAVESREQVQFLMKHYGVTEVEPTKGELKLTGKGGDFGYARGSAKYDSLLLDRRLPVLKAKEAAPDAPTRKKIVPEGVGAKTKSYEPMASARGLWKRRKQV